MLIGNAPCSWGIAYPSGNALSWEEYLDEVAAAGYRGTELGPLPDGAVDIAAVMRFLEETGFDGPVVVEQDIALGAAESPPALAARNLAYLEGLA